MDKEIGCDLNLRYFRPKTQGRMTTESFWFLLRPCIIRE